MTPCAQIATGSNVYALRPAHAGNPVLPPGGDGSVTTLPPGVLARHLRHLELRGQRTYDRQRAIARLSAALPVPLLQATPADLLAWRETLRSLAAETVVHYVMHANQLYKWAIAEGLADHNPAARLPVPRTGRRLPRPISEDDLMRAVASAPPRIRPWLILAGWEGLRACEIAWLRVECVLASASPPVLVVAPGATKGHGPGRVVPLCSFALSELHACGLPASGVVFRRADGQRGPNSPALVSQLANSCLHSIGITATLHQCRHRCLTQLYHETHDLRLVQEFAGHADPAATAGYTAFSNPVMAAAVEALPVPPPRTITETDWKEDESGGGED